METVTSTLVASELQSFAGLSKKPNDQDKCAAWLRISALK